MCCANSCASSTWKGACHIAERNRLLRSEWRNGSLREETLKSGKTSWRSKSTTRRHSQTPPTRHPGPPRSLKPRPWRRAAAGSTSPRRKPGLAGGLGPPPDLPRAHAPPTRKWVKGRRRRPRGWGSGAVLLGTDRHGD